jgi:hypothetical protein
MITKAPWMSKQHHQFRQEKAASAVHAISRLLAAVQNAKVNGSVVYNARMRGPMRTNLNAHFGL